MVGAPIPRIRSEGVVVAGRKRVRSRTIVPLCVSSVIVLAGSLLTFTAAPAVSISNSCRARNATKGTIARSDLQTVIRNASAGDVIEVRNICIGHFVIGKRLTLLGKATPAVPKPALHAGGSGRTLRVTAQVMLRNLRILGGNVPTGRGGGISNDGTLTLRDSIVRGNHTHVGGGIYNDFSGSVTLAGTSSVSENVVNGSGGGIFVGSGGGGGNTTNLTMSSSASVAGNRATGWGGGIYIVGTGGRAALNDSSSVTGNTADTDDAGGGVGGGIFSECDGVLTGAVEGSNVDENVSGTASPIADDIALEIC
jgi:hypothetical protein